MNIYERPEMKNVSKKSTQRLEQKLMEQSNSIQDVSERLRQLERRVSVLEGMWFKEQSTKQIKSNKRKQNGDKSDAIIMTLIVSIFIIGFIVLLNVIVSQNELNNSWR